MSAPVSFERVRNWFEKAGTKAAAQGRHESAALWSDGLAHLNAMHAALQLAEQALSTLPLGAASLKTANALEAVRKAIDAAKGTS